MLVLLPIPGSSLQAWYSGPYVVQEKINDRDYIVATPERRQQSRLCHINMLKPYLHRESPAEEKKTVLSLSSAEIIDQTGDTVVLSSADPGEMPLASAESDSEHLESVLFCTSTEE